VESCRLHHFTAITATSPSYGESRHCLGLLQIELPLTFSSLVQTYRSTPGHCKSSSTIERIRAGTDTTPPDRTAPPMIPRRHTLVWRVRHTLGVLALSPWEHLIHQQAVDSRATVSALSAVTIVWERTRTTPPIRATSQAVSTVGLGQHSGLATTFGPGQESGQLVHKR
jgi:hypothetical protein